jgi:2-isopropylmalate synthase
LSRISIFDTTLRDGEQAPGIALRPDQKAEIASQLERLGVDVVEAGFPISSPGDFEGVRQVAAAARKPVVAALARACKEDIDAAAAALEGSRRSRIHIVLATSPLHMRVKLRRSPEEVVEQAAWAVGYAAGLSDELEFSCEDATRSEPEFVARVCAGAVERGATVINLPDTVGYSLPGEYGAFLTEVRRRCPELADVQLSAHCHDDLGLATANTLAGVEAGCTQVEVAMNGLGERAGNAALEEVVVGLHVRANHFEAPTGIALAEIGATSRLVARHTGYAVQRNKAVVGANAFAHEAGIHQDGMLKDPATYQILDPGELGMRMTLPLGKHSGRHAFAIACRDFGTPLEGDALDAAFRRCKELADGGHEVVLDDVLALETAR